MGKGYPIGVIFLGSGLFLIVSGLIGGDGMFISALLRVWLGGSLVCIGSVMWWLKRER